MQEHWSAICGQANIELDPTATERRRLAEAGERILGCVGGSATVTDHGRENTRADFRLRGNPRHSRSQVADPKARTKPAPSASARDHVRKTCRSKNHSPRGKLGTVATA